MSAPTRLVFHPGFGVPYDDREVAEALDALPDVEVLRPRDRAGVAACLRQGAEVLITYEWCDTYLSESLRWVQGQGVGVDQYPLEALRTRGVVLTNARGIASDVIAEHAFGLLLAMTRGLVMTDRPPDGGWKPTVNVEISGLTMGILGLGSVGEAIALRAVNWGLNLIGIVAHPDKYRGIVTQVYGPESIERVCGESHIVICCLPGGSSTYHRISTRELKALGAGWLINVGRGSVVDSRALCDALARGELRGAGLDVFEEEPLPHSSPLWSFDNVVITPHVAGATPRYPERLASLVAQNLAALLGTRQWINRVV